MSAVPAARQRLGLCVFFAAALHGALLFGLDLPLPTPQALPVVAIKLAGKPEPPVAPAPAAMPAPARPERPALPVAAPAPATEQPPRSAPAHGDLAGKSALALARAVAHAAGRQTETPVRLGDAAPKGVDFAFYLDAWRRKVERIGQLNYPAEAKAQGLGGTLTLRVSIAADGALNDVRVVRGSGHAVLDAAALRIVRLAAPYAPFSPTMRAAARVIEIERTWQFRNSRLSA